MSTVRELHNQAMSLAQQAMIARHEGKTHLAIELASQAVELEYEAAQRIVNDPGSEPTRSILYRSAASLALQADEFTRARSLAMEGLAGYPPPQIRFELTNLLEEVRHGAYLQQKGMVLDDSELRLSLKGNAVGIGMIEYEQFIQRIEALKALVTRTIQRLMGRKYQQRGRIAEIYNLYSPTLAIPGQNSFVITFKLGARPQDAPQLITATPAQIFSDIITAMKLVNSETKGDLRSHFGKDEAYYKNFVSLASASLG